MSEWVTVATTDEVPDGELAAATLDGPHVFSYNLEAVYAALEDRDCHPIMPLRETPAVKRGDHKPPRCQHGKWRFAGSDYSRKASKWRCPTGECKPASRWLKADRLHTLIPRETLR
jgi:nitrite reductase/ring-hydroxylating ferredoxin subunit